MYIYEDSSVLGCEALFQGGHIPEELNLEKQSCENLHGDPYQFLRNILSVEWKKYTQSKIYMSENQTEIKSSGLRRCIIVIGLDMKLLNVIITKL